MSAPSTTDARPTALELCIEGISEDAMPYRDTIYLIVAAGTDVDEAVARICDEHELSLTELAFADDTAFAGSGLTPANLDRDTFLQLAAPLPDRTQPFSCETHFIDLHDPAWSVHGGW